MFVGDLGGNLGLRSLILLVVNNFQTPHTDLIYYVSEFDLAHFHNIMMNSLTALFITTCKGTVIGTERVN